MAGSITIGGNVTGGLTGSTQIGPLTILGSLVSAQDYNVILATGDNTIPIPAGSAFVVFQPCAGLATVTLRTTGLSTGIPVSPANPFVYPFDPLNTPASLIVNVGTAVSGTFSEFTFN